MDGPLGLRPGCLIRSGLPTGVETVAKGVCKDGGPDVNGDTLFETGSATKTFTAVLLQLMVDNGEVALDDPIGSISHRTRRRPAAVAGKSLWLTWPPFDRHKANAVIDGGWEGFHDTNGVFQSNPQTFTTIPGARFSFSTASRLICLISGPGDSTTRPAEWPGPGKPG